jgi:hypothetical protein
MDPLCSPVSSVVKLLNCQLAQRVKVLQPCDKRQSRIAYRRFIEGHEQSLTFSLQPNCEGHGLHRAPFFF